MCAGVESFARVGGRVVVACAGPALWSGLRAYVGAGTVSGRARQAVVAALAYAACASTSADHQFVDLAVHVQFGRHRLALRRTFNE
ncbi:hypothetical protein CF640_36670 [Burkholderia pseudomallei]|nr:hypothetical protein CF640_36670 [Burkholderia pseudomallei]